MDNQQEGGYLQEVTSEANVDRLRLPRQWEYLKCNNGNGLSVSCVQVALRTTNYTPGASLVPKNSIYKTSSWTSKKRERICKKWKG